MKTENSSGQIRTRKFGANRKETANKPQKLKPGFSQSKDIHEDRAIRHKKFAPPQIIV